MEKKNYRVIFVNEHITVCAEHRELLSEEEREFVASIVPVKPETLSTADFNKLSGIATKVMSAIKKPRSISRHGRH